MQFILEAQAKNEALIGMLGQHVAETDARVAANDARLTRRMDGITKLIRIGARQLVKLNQQMERLTERVDRLSERMDQLASAQVVTEQKLQVFLDGLNKPRNGH